MRVGNRLMGGVSSLHPSCAMVVLLPGQMTRICSSRHLAVPDIVLFYGARETGGPVVVVVGQLSSDLLSRRVPRLDEERPVAGGCSISEAQCLVAAVRELRICW